jgi:hypothetical protein
MYRLAEPPNSTSFRRDAFPTPSQLCDEPEEAGILPRASIGAIGQAGEDESAWEVGPWGSGTSDVGDHSPKRFALTCVHTQRLHIITCVQERGWRVVRTYDSRDPVHLLSATQNRRFAKDRWLARTVLLCRALPEADPTRSTTQHRVPSSDGSARKKARTAVRSRRLRAMNRQAAPLDGIERPSEPDRRRSGTRSPGCWSRLRFVRR